MPILYAGRTNEASGKCTPQAMAALRVAAYGGGMARKQYRPTHIRQWRLYRGYTLERLAEMVGTTHATLSRVERGLHPYNQELLELIAEALSTDAASLIMRDPSKADAIWTIWEQAKPGERDQITALAETVLAFRAKDSAAS